MEFVERVLEWNRAAGRTENEFNVRAVALHIGLQLEEMAEKLEAVSEFRLVADLHHLGMLFKKGTYDHLVESGNRTAMIDADCDIMVVTAGAMQASGANVHGALGEVCRSNESKAVGCNSCKSTGKRMVDDFEIICDGADCNKRGWILVKDANGKIQKGPDYTEPQLEQFTALRLPTEGGAA